MEVLKIQILSAENIGKVWISRKQIILASFHAMSVFFAWAGKMQKKMQDVSIFSLVGQWTLFTPVGPLIS